MGIPKYNIIVIDTTQSFVCRWLYTGIHTTCAISAVAQLLVNNR